MLAGAVLAFAWPATAAQPPEDGGLSPPYICGTPDAPPEAAKSSALPAPSKIYSGKPVALLVRIAFSDQPYLASDSAIAKTHAAINVFYRDMSRNTFEFDFKVHPVIWMAGGTGAHYAANFGSLQGFISGKLREAGYAKGSGYSVYVASFPRIGLPWSGMSSGPSGGANYINGSYAAGVTAHELGHAIGLPHAHSIEAGSDVFGTPGTSGQHVEYGNPFDVMGNAPGMGHFNANYKRRIGWLDANEVLEAKASGVYRLHAGDNGAHRGRLLSLRVPSGDSRFAYWFEYRTAAAGARAGAGVLFEGFMGPGNRGIHLLDMTPESRPVGDALDGVLDVGRELMDKYGGTTFKALAIHEGAWNEEGWVDLSVTIPGTQMARFDGRTAILTALRPGNSRVLDLMGRTLGNALPAKILIVKGGNAYTMTTSAEVFQAAAAR